MGENWEQMFCGTWCRVGSSLVGAGSTPGIRPSSSEQGPEAADPALPWSRPHLPGRFPCGHERVRVLHLRGPEPAPTPRAVGHLQAPCVQGVEQPVHSLCCSQLSDTVSVEPPESQEIPTETEDVANGGSSRG